ncbi:1-phosphofructokinase [Paenibacillus caui]|uniref:1-phosphofructokinase n=1 Tax=Paenibacillus caui TaxID=2873927 RepID=UPI001CA9843D|nr:1-phosphofructokinase [Paenibacillus caui]
MKKSVLTVTLNPALDRTVTLPFLQVGGLNRIKEMRTDPGGKGINVTKVLQQFGDQVTAVGLAGGYAGKQLIAYLKALNINCEFIPIQGETRTNLKIVDEDQGLTTEINERGAEVNDAEKELLLSKMDLLLDQASVLVLGGSLPPGLPVSIYKELIEMATAKGVKTILDADGSALSEGLKAKPFAIKPNIHELEELLDMKLETDQQIVEAARRLLGEGTKWIIVSMGGAGSIFISEDQIVRARPFPIVPQSTVGAGDSMVAAISSCLLRERSLEETARWATAAGSITASKPGTEVCSLEEVNAHLKDVIISDGY